MLLDWELAGRDNQHVWWTGLTLPSAVRAGSERYTCKTDVKQIGMLSHASPSASYAAQLMSGHVISAAMAPVAERND